MFPLTPAPPNKCWFYFCCFFLWILRIISKGTTNDSRLWATYRQKGNDPRQNNRKKISLIPCGPQCWCKYFFSFLSFCSLSNVIKYFTGRVKFNKYGWRNFIQQEITRKVKKNRGGSTHISATVQWCVSPLRALPVLNPSRVTNSVRWWHFL